MLDKGNFAVVTFQSEVHTRIYLCKDSVCVVGVGEVAEGGGPCDAVLSTTLPSVLPRQ